MQYFTSHRTKDPVTHMFRCKKNLHIVEQNEVIIKQEECIEQDKAIYGYKKILEGGGKRSMRGKKNFEGKNNSGDYKSCSDPLADIKSVWTCRFCGRSARGHLNQTCLYCFSPL